MRKILVIEPKPEGDREGFPKEVMAGFSLKGRIDGQVFSRWKGTGFGRAFQIKVIPYAKM